MGRLWLSLRAALGEGIEDWESSDLPASARVYHARSPSCGASRLQAPLTCRRQGRGELCKYTRQTCTFISATRSGIRPQAQGPSTGVKRATARVPVGQHSSKVRQSPKACQLGSTSAEFVAVQYRRGWTCGILDPYGKWWDCPGVHYALGLGRPSLQTAWQLAPLTRATPCTSTTSVFQATNSNEAEFVAVPEGVHALSRQSRKVTLGPCLLQCSRVSGCTRLEAHCHIRQTLNPGPLLN